MKILLIMSVAVMSFYIANAQNKISGLITNQDSKPLVGATIFIPDLNKGIVSNRNGKYELNNMPNGKIKIQYSYIGFSNHIETFILNNDTLELNVVLIPSVIEAEGIVVSGGYHSTQHENAVKIDVLNLNTLTTKNTSNFTELLTQIPGVDMISKGNGVSKPVIRGLSMNDILVLNNGVRFENYQYSSHHPLGIDEFGIENVEVIKGPASLLYGSDAIGGVINFIKEKPANVGSIIGDYNLQLFSNSLGITNNLGINGASKNLFGGFRLGQKTNSDFLQGGGDYVPNSRFNEISAKANAGFTDEIGTFKLFYDYNNQKLGLVEDEAVESINDRGRENKIWYQEFNTHLISMQNKLYLNNYKLDLNIAYQNTELIHFGNIDEIELQMKLATFNYEVKLHLPSNENTEYIVGFQGFNQTNSNTNDRESILLPNANTDNYSAFGLLQYSIFKNLKIQTGLRYDIKSIQTKSIGIPADTMSYRTSLDKSFGSLNGSFGAVYNLSNELLFRANFASAYRTPNLAELTSKGQHELRFELGDNRLEPEYSLEADLSVHYHIDNLTLDFAGFYNVIDNYIFISPTGDTTDKGINIFKYKQENSSLFGFEAGMHIHPESMKWLHFETTFSSVIGKQENGDYLPFVPAHKLKFELRAEKGVFLFVKNAFVSVNSTIAFDQNNAAPDETITNGYTIWDLNMGGNIIINNQIIVLSISGSNIFDTKYIDHLSTLKEVNFYNPGRNISLSLKVPFAILMNDAE